MVRAIEQLRQAMEACELGALSLPDQIDALMDAGKEVLQEVSTLTPPNEPLTLEQLREAPHGKIKDSTLQSICNRANEIARRPPEGETDE